MLMLLLALAKKVLRLLVGRRANPPGRKERRSHGL